MSLKYRVKLKCNNGYKRIDNNIGKEFDAVLQGSLYMVSGLLQDSTGLPISNTGVLAFDVCAVEVMELSTVPDTVEDICRAYSEDIKGQPELPYHSSVKTS